MPAKTITVQHFAGFVFDTDRNQVEDARTIFSTAAHVKGGTEAGPGAPAYRKALAAEAKKAGFVFFNPGPQDCWVAMHRDIIADKHSVRTGCPIIIPRAKAQTPPDPHPYSAKGIPWIKAATIFGGQPLTFTEGHWLTKGRSKGQAQADNPRCRTNHFVWNTKMAHATVELLERKTQNGGWGLAAADGNLIDRTSDVFRGADATTCWDALDKWPPTGHGNIDWIALVDSCRAKFTSARTMPGHFNTDHTPVEAKVQLRW